MTVVALVPAYRSQDRVGDTVRALLSLDDVDSVIVIDDGSDDDTAVVARRAGATLVQLPANRGKGGAIAAGIAAAPDADIYLLIDADLTSTAVEADRLLGPVLEGRADLVIGSFERANSSGGFGLIKGMAARLIARSGQEVTEPLSGQRAIVGSLLRSLDLGSGFGLETAMTMDALAAGARVVEVPVGMTHRRTGRDLRGIIHRARQGIDIARVAWPRLVSPVARTAGLVALLMVVVVAAMFGANARETHGTLPPSGRADRVIVIGVPRLGSNDLDPLTMPNLWAMAQHGGVGVITPRTPASNPSELQAWATMGAGAPTLLGAIGVDVAEGPGVGDQVRVVPGDQQIDGGTAAQVSARITGKSPSGPQVVLGSTLRKGDLRSYGQPGRLGDLVRRAGGRTQVVSSEFLIGLPTDASVDASSAVAAMGSDRSVDTATVGPSLLVPDPAFPDGYRTDVDRLVTAVAGGPAKGLTVVGLGDPERAAIAAERSEPVAGAQLERRVQRATDLAIGRIAALADGHTAVIVVGLTPPTSSWELTPMVAEGGGVKSGTMFSASTRRQGLLTLTDVAPTVVRLLGIGEPSDFVGNSAERSDDQAGMAAEVASMQELNTRATQREDAYIGIIVAFVIGQALIYGALAFSFRRIGRTRWVRFLEGCGIGSAAWPLSTFIIRAGPVGLGKPVVTSALIVLICVAAGWIGTRMRSTPLAPLNVICVITLALLAIDLGTGGHLQESSIIGYSPLFASRFYGVGNMAYSVLASVAVILALRVTDGTWSLGHRAVRVGSVLVFAILLDILPTLGADVGGLIALVPAFAVLGVSMVGLKWTRRTIAWCALGIAVAGTAAIALASRGETHLSKFLKGDSASITETIQRKIETNIRVLGLTTWSWMVPIVLIFMFRVLVIGHAGRWVFGGRRNLRLAFAAVLAVGVIGALVNDSGVVITAISFLYIGSMLALLMLRQPFSEPEILGPIEGSTDEVEAQGDQHGPRDAQRKPTWSPAAG